MKLKIGPGVIAIILLLISTLSAYAQQGVPCVPDDGDGSCPLDTWVIILVVAVSVFAAFRLYRRKKTATQIVR